MCACLRRESRGARLTGPCEATAHAFSGAEKSLPWQEGFWGAGERRGAGVSRRNFSKTGKETRKSLWYRGRDGEN